MGKQAIPMARIPWASAILALVCLAGPLWVDEGRPGRKADPSLREAAQYWRTHPHLRAVPQVERADFAAAPMAVVGQPDTPRDWALQQRELDRLTRAGLEAAVAETNARAESRLQRWGVLPESLTLRRMLTHLLVSPGWLVALCHLLALGLVAVVLEAQLGPALFVALALGSAGCGAAVHGLLVSAGSPPLVGTAALLAGLLAGFAVCMGRRRVSLSEAAAAAPHGLLAASADARLLLAGALVCELLATWLGWTASVAPPWRAQLGGGVFGAFSLLGLRLPRALEWLRARARVRSVERAVAQPSLATGLAARDAGDFVGALRILELTRERDPRDPDVSLAVWETALMAKQAARGAPALAGLVAHRVAVGEEALALDHWLDLHERVPDAQVEPAALLRLVPLLQERGFTDRAVQALRACASAAGELPAGLALRTADLAREIDPASARRAARRALEFPDLHESKRERMRELLAGLGEPAAPAAAAASRPAARREAVVSQLAPTIEGVDELEGADDAPRFTGLKLVDALPVKIDVEVLRLRLADGSRARVAYANVDAVAVAAVRGLGPRPVLVVDLLLNWSSFDEERLRVIRLRSTAFDPRGLFPGSADALGALRSLVDELLQRTGAMALPDVQAAYGRPFRVFDDLACYQREVLQVEG